MENEITPNVQEVLDLLKYGEPENDLVERIKDHLKRMNPKATADRIRVEMSTMTEEEFHRRWK